MARSKGSGKAGRGKSAKRGGRRRHYAPPPDQIGYRRYLPVGWVNWLGMVLFALIFVALLVETVVALIEADGTDPIAAGFMTVAFGYMVYLFGTTRLREQ